jgi:hypothetical protein
VIGREIPEREQHQGNDYPRAESDACPMHNSLEMISHRHDEP